MATHATIGIKIGNKVKAVHLTYDGYPSYVLPELVNNYNTEDKVIQLLSKGRIHEIKRVDKEGNRVGDATFSIELEEVLKQNSKKDLESFEVDYETYKNIDFDKFKHNDYESMYYYLYDGKEWTFAQLTGMLGAMYKDNLSNNEYRVLRNKYLEEAKQKEEN